MGGRPWIARAAPERVAALKGEKSLWDVRLGEDDGACCAERRDELYGTCGFVRGKLWEGLAKRNVRRRPLWLAYWPIVYTLSYYRTPSR